MEISVKTIQHLAHLSRLQINETQAAQYQTDMQRMVSFIEQLQEVNTDGVEPLLMLSDSSATLREDQLHKSLTAADALKNAPSHDHQYFKVPTVIKK
ncbi:MAG: aspartyl/glutamyl-tRNA(Asn/Gln) amidotransferase subunit C [Sphingobacteriia bacterium 24-36-13]|jgi:aspartyl-tRNA(Asn)/glutamyl-tRNA(Gln) amidotransferase subunit C|uniref:Asp-tRNA(Asn)/Glu-tRNA(Gln) amidotransferase subunit GatC n=1 Tax=Sediminibacterium sp. TaxID=1917865 RepID=UPI000BD8DA3F|nr:Asp-tRNA(Asn)/Glu-tRNA(Gln) amidotransferase subunit GatC [Sediminibacterium sp.]OYY09989.1 MAG: aspartyl/glutamyl-tRNA(Asn/Gln) amidotransferase subunit C [Sphingobacteriia bacterium 35-36-14]OYZ53403.1 MAG: aspartyl/glutamyl-tRNA(Asn/Gln) amidotransferase subunit C [Sphingobacteriia bacterium 24-36-13]OZA65071.1 MAG: aspartyl/glutamyl-tRNA(Asn/Gln) amidotransferase subunit C [Sphingobacteriia bacterium 39-36-14]HQS25278.1 Asp-tRNA(Asn)/Glu-tRNA(Gln) amidotransferase subunit GatC [Sediminib